jgi:aspartate aminotransferase
MTNPINLAKRLKAVRPSPTLALNARAKALAAKGEDVINLAVGEPDYDTPAHVKEAAKAAIDAGFTKYTPTGGIPELKAAIVRKLARDNALTYVPEQTLVSVGAKHSLYNIFQALLTAGDEVIFFAPYWVSYGDMVKLAEGTPVVLETSPSNNFAPDPNELRRALTPRTRAVVLNSPSNPTGAVLSEASLKAIAEVLRGHDCLIITDDIYEKLLFTGKPFQNLANVAPDLFPRMVVVNGLSKAFAMTGWRVGYTAGPKELIAGMQMVQDQSTSNPNSIAQKAAVAALDGPMDTVTAMAHEFQVRRDLMVAGLNQVSGFRCLVPDGAFYAFPNVEQLIGKAYKGTPITGSLKLSELLLDEVKLAAVPGDAFGAEGFLRLSYATSRPQIEKALARLKDFASQVS